MHINPTATNCTSPGVAPIAARRPGRRPYPWKPGGTLPLNLQVVADAQLAACAYADALARHLEALSLWRALANVHGQVRCLRGIATVDLYVGDYARALGRFEEALALLRTQHDVALEAGVFHGLGMVYARLGELTKAHEFHELSLARRRELNDQAGVAASLNSLG